MTQPLLDFKAACEWLAKKDKRFEIDTSFGYRLIATHIPKHHILFDLEFVHQDDLDQLTGMLGWEYEVTRSDFDREWELEICQGWKWHAWKSDSPINSTRIEVLEWENYVPDKLTAALVAATQIIYKKYPKE